MKIKEFKSLIDQSRNITAFTGAGISTESGIPDYRSKGGIWDQFQPVYFNEFLTDENKRLLYWQRKIELWDGISKARPNTGHMFFKKLYDQGKLLKLITQNIDGLHEKSGIPSQTIINLHGTNLEIVCLECGFLLPSEEVFENIDLDHDVPRCPRCKGLLKPNTISFGQSLRSEDLEQAKEASLSCDLMIAAGSTLIVQPAASFPLLAKQNGARLIIITLSETPLDSYADCIIHEKMGEVMKGLFP